MQERDFQRRVTDLCDWLGLRYWHDYDSRRNKAGFPDLVIVGPGGLLFAELKTEKGRVSKEQQAWLSALLDVGVRVYVWRPSDWPRIVQDLKEIA